MNPDSHIWTSTDFGLDDIGSPSAGKFGIPEGPRYRTPTWEDTNARMIAADLRKAYEEERQRVWKAAEAAVASSQAVIQQLTDQTVALRMQVSELEQELYGLYAEALSE